MALRHRDGHELELDVLAHRRAPVGGPAEWLVVSAVAGPADTLSTETLEQWAFRQSPDSLAIFDTDRRLVQVSVGMQQALRLTEKVMRGLRMTDIAPGEGSTQIDSGMRRALECGEVQRRNAALRLPGTSPGLGWSAYLTPLKDPGGRVRAVCLAAHPGPEGSFVQQREFLVHEAEARIGSSLDIGLTAQEFSDVAVPDFADFVAVDLLDFPQQLDAAAPVSTTKPVVVRRAAYRSVLKGSGLFPAAAGAATFYPAASPPAQCLALGHAALYGSDALALDGWAQADAGAAWLGGAGMQSLMVVPLVSDGSSLGIALFARHRHREPFDVGDLRVAEELAAKAAVALDHARRHTQARTTTMALQRSLLPQTLPDQTAVGIASRYVPAVTQAGVGGDWFDVIPLSGARVALVVGDVVGHGIRASATMGRLRTAVRTLADVDLPADELLTHLDDLVLHLSVEEGARDPAAETAVGIGSTCLYAIYDPVSRRCTLARAGHPPPAVVTPDGVVRFLDVPAGPPLGLGGMPFEAVEAELPEGSLIVLYTDGLLEAREHDIDEALDKMFAALARPAMALETICDRVLTALLTHPPADDVALLVARTRALHADRVATWDLDFDFAVVSRARRHTGDQLAAWGLDDAAFISELVVSELVTNAIRYGQPPIQLRLIHQDSTLVCEVFDSGSTTPHMRRARTFDEGGRGLLMVAQLVQRWGTRHDRVGKTVWAEQSLAAI
ncbi:SpoIIE family protein phosphatase [Streptomyces monashensis]|uniref:SpoIIE family protein phosphatase n=1 Tax=Streptomyces monashensis TaxID=1678012 RepID=UPI001FE8C6B4|nr:SpoIIE family protein phosphatase [Streptomyces monashensis]